MTMKIVKTTERIITDDELKKAIELRHCDCFTAMALCRDLGRKELEIEWQLVAMFSPVELIQEALGRGLDMSEWRPAVHAGNPLLKDTKLYRAVIEHLEAQQAPTEAQS